MSGGIRGAVGAALVAAVLVAGLVGGCRVPPQVVQDPPYVERLRLRITKVRHAIRETREAIALSRGAAWQPELYVRLAELMSEEARYHYEVAYEREQRTTEVLHVPQVRFLKEQAIAVYRTVLEEHPTTGLADRILFNIGHELRELGRYDEMIATLERLDREHPGSPLRPEALLVLGDHWFDKADLERAERHYRDVTRGPPARVQGLAHYKLGWVWLNRADCRRALASFEEAIAVRDAWEAGDGATTPGGGGATAQQGIDVRREALVDLVYCYATEKKTDDMLAWFRARAYTRAAYVAAMERLAARYGVVDDPKGVLLATRELLRLAPTEPDRLDDARMLYGAARREEAWADVGDDIALITGAMRRQLARVETSDEQRGLVSGEFELYARDLSTRAQTAFLAAPAAAKRDALGASVVRAYEAWLEAFPAAAARRDILENLADTLAALGRHAEAGLRYAEAADTAPDAATRQKGLYDAVVQLQRSLGGLAERSPVERVVVRAALRRAAAELLAAGMAGAQARVVKLAIGQTWYDEGRFREAIEHLAAVAWEYPGTEEASAAIHLVLDSHHTLNDFEGLIAAGHRFLAPDGPAPPAVRAELMPIVKAAENRRLDEVSLAAAGAEGGDMASLEAFASRYQGTPLGERALVNAFVAARAAGDTERMDRLGEELAAAYPASAQVRGILASLGKQAVATLDVDRALRLFQRAEGLAPQHRAPLRVATGELLEALGDAEGALTAYADAAGSAGPGAPRSLALERLAGALERQGDAARTVATLGPLAGDAPPMALAVLGLAQVTLGQTDAAEATLGRVLADAAGAPVEAVARAHYGMAGALTAVLARYTPGTDLDAVQELVTLVEVTEQGWLNAARQGSPVVTPAALGRLAAMARGAAARLEALPVPEGLTGADAETFRRGLAGRVAQLRSTASEALAACAQEVWKSHLFSAPARSCLAGKETADAALRLDRLRPRTPAVPGEEAEPLRQRLGKNPEDVEALQALSVLYLDAGDAHVARLGLERAEAAGAGPEVLNLLGLAAWRAGDTGGAMEAFARAADGGLEAGRQNLEQALRMAGLTEAAREVFERWPAGQGGGRRLGEPR